MTHADIKRHKMAIRFRRFRRRSPQYVAKLTKNHRIAIAATAANLQK